MGDENVMIYSISDTSAALGIKTRTVRQWIRDGKIKASIPPGRKSYEIPRSEIDRLRSEIDANLGSEFEEEYNVEEVAGMLGIKVRTVRQWIADGKIKASKLTGSKSWVIFESEVERVREARMAILRAEMEKVMGIKKED